MSKTIVVYGEYGHGDDYTKHVLFAGDASLEAKADEHAKNAFHDDITKQVWASGTLIQEFEWLKGKWEKTHDVRDNLEKEIENLKFELSQKESIMEDIEKLF